MTGRPPQRFRWLLHVDLDQFQVSVERLRSPELAEVPVIVGGNGDPTEARKVVTCASYEARDVGVRAGMPLRAAYRKMPDAIYLPLDTPTYDVASGEVMAVLRGFGHPLEVWGWDEAYLGVGPIGTADAPTPLDPDIAPDDIRQVAADIRTAVLDRTGLRSAVGISDNKQRAKMATGFAKRATGTRPEDRVFLLDATNWIALMGDRPVRDLWSVGPRTADKLGAHSIDTVRDLIDAPRDDLIDTFGPHQGNWLYVLCRGGGDSTVTEEPWLARSHSKSRTYATDLVGLDELRPAAAELAQEVLEQVVTEEREVFRVAVTVRTTTFYTRTKSRKLPAPTIRLDDIAPVVADLLGRFDIDRPVRLLGVRLDLVTEEDAA
ncbi:DNA polymerase IV [Gordonia soli]|uniref:DNA-directed DNA polymerase n=1 Tax=Gordonia soli NBRC 108243 TaxID=1223545 RepID=M0QKF9_9ACTN|nr:DNA polymerase IV [Gordonia soli]GAC67897.1 DNA polymerase IV [Gordonia soli NBRC 108243]